VKKIKNPVSVGSWGQTDAQRIAGTLAIHMNISANVVNVTVRDNEPTSWYEVQVSTKDAKLAQVYLKGWNAGRAIMRIEDHPANASLWPEYAAFFPNANP
jgi:hypothetical protein